MQHRNTTMRNWPARISVASSCLIMCTHGFAATAPDVQQVHLGGGAFIECGFGGGCPVTSPPGSCECVSFSQLQLTIHVPDHGVITSFESVSLFGFQHQFAGDLTVTLVHAETGSSAALFDGAAMSAGNTNLLLGDYHFTSTGETMKLPGDDGDVLPGSYLSFEPLSVFDGEDKFGEWNLTLVDTFPADGSGDVEGFGFFLGFETDEFCVGDLNEDGDVGPTDLATLLGNWGAPIDCAGGSCPDLDLDGFVGPADLALLLGNWGLCAT